MSLPKLQLRHFNGDLTKWTSFWESFEAAVDKNSDLSGVEKFNCLSSLLEGTAKEAVSGLSLTEANYAGAVSMLKKRFGSTQMIVSKHMEALLQVEAVSSTLDVKALRQLFDTISSHVRSLSAMNVQEDSYSNLLCPVLIKKIPPELQLIVSRKVSEENWNLGKLMAAIEEEVIARERLGQSQLKASVHKGHSKPSPSAVTLVTKGHPTSAPRCCYCDQTHSPTECTEVTEVDKRRQLLRKAGRCYSCLRKGHIYRDCRTSNRCQSCQGKHHTSICATKGESTFQDTPASTTLAEPTTSNLNPSAPEFEQLHVVTLHRYNQDCSVADSVCCSIQPS